MINDPEITRRRAALPLLLVIVSLAALALLPIVIQGRIGAIRREISDVADPARSDLTELQLALALELAGTRGFLLTGDRRYAAARNQAHATKSGVYARLVPLARRLGPDASATALALGEHMRAYDTLDDALFEGQLSASEYVARLDEQQARFRTAIASAGRLDEVIRLAAAELRKDILVTERINVMLTAVLVLLAFAAALLVARLGRQYRILVQRLDLRVRQQQGLREVARQLSASMSVKDAVQTIAEHALTSTHALGAYVERVEMPEPGTEVEIVAVAGTGSPPIGTRIPFPGSLSEEIIESGEPRILTEAGAIGERLAPYLHERCSGCSVLIVSLTSEKTILGALVLLRGPDQPHFTPEEAVHARTLGDLASAALRRVMLLEKLTESETRFRQIAENLDEVIWLGNPDMTARYYVNPAYERIWGRSRESFYQYPRSPIDAIHPEDRARVEARFPGMYRGEYELEYRIVRPDGEVRWILSRGYPIRNEHGEMYRIAGIMEDVTERKLAEAERERLLARERAARERATSILESITDAFYALDREWRFTYVNREAERMLRRSREELIGMRIWDEYRDLVDTILYREYHRALDEGAAVQFELFYPPLDTWFEVRAYPASQGLSVYFRDITARKHAEEQLRESERNFRALGNSIPQLAWMADPAGDIYWYNQRWYEYTGMPPEQTEGWGWTTAVHPDHAASVVERLRHAFATGQPWEDTFPFRSRTGEYRWFLSRALPIRNREGQVIRWVGTNTDVTERVAASAERELLLAHTQAARADAERRQEELERVTESRTRLMRGFSHDVKNPLGAADGHAQLLEDGILGELSEQQRDSVGRIRRSIHSSLHLIDDLLELARAEAGQLEIAREPTDVAAIASDVTDDFRAKAEAKGLALDIHAGDDAHTETDPVRVRQVLGNLLSNAVKYTREGQVAVTVEVHADGDGPRPGEWIAVRVRDTGPGIPPDKRERIFQEFTRLDPEAEQGAGVGLAISRRITELMGGEITLESEVGRGSTFTLWIPRVASSA